MVYLLGEKSSTYIATPWLTMGLHVYIHIVSWKYEKSKVNLVHLTYLRSKV
jgi:hypothetical protein